jgi:hypothetical protein
MAKKTNHAAVELGRRGGKARLKKLTSEKRSEVARTAAAARWGQPMVENWQRDTPPFKVSWGHDGYIIGFRYRREQAMAWHITTVQQVTIHDFFVIDGRLHFIHETRATFSALLPLIFETDDAEANPTTEERMAVLAAIKQWENAFDKKVTGTRSEGGIQR